MIQPYRLNSPSEQYARLLLLVGNDAEYRRLCQQLTENMGPDSDPGGACLLASICTAGPRSGIEPTEVVRWAEQALVLSRSPWHLLALGAAKYRAGRYDQAVLYLEESNARSGSRGETVNPFLLAMAYHQLRQYQKSQTCYARGVDLRSRKPPEFDDPPKGSTGSFGDSDGVSQWINLNLMHREAQALLGMADVTTRPPGDTAPKSLQAPLPLDQWIDVLPRIDRACLPFGEWERRGRIARQVSRSEQPPRHDRVPDRTGGQLRPPDRLSSRHNMVSFCRSALYSLLLRSFDLRSVTIFNHERRLQCPSRNRTCGFPTSGSSVELTSRLPECISCG